MAWYDYNYNFPVHRQVNVKWLTPILIFVGLFYVIVITLINVAAVGYETVVFTSTDYNETHSLWFDRFTPWNSNHRNCNTALIRLNDYMTTSSEFTFFLYQLLDYISLEASVDSVVSPLNELNYVNNQFLDCSLSTLQMVEYLEPVPPQLKATAVVGCNTTSGNYLQLQTSTEIGLSAVVDLSPAAFKAYIDGFSGPFTIENSIAIWSLMTRRLFYSLSTIPSTISPLYDRNSLLRAWMVGPTLLSFIRFAYTDSFYGETPANGSWSMDITFQNNTGALYQTGYLTFSVMGELEAESPVGFLDTVNEVLAPTINETLALAKTANITDFDFWELMNWIFVSEYWLILLDFGQIAPTTFEYDALGDLLNYGPVRYTSENNIFVNGTLFDYYNSYLRNTIIPLFSYTLAEFLPLNETNRMNETTTSLKILYTCSDLQLKTPVSLIISVLIADWGLISSMIAMIVFILGVWKAREVIHGTIPIFWKNINKRESLPGLYGIARWHGWWYT